MRRLLIGAVLILLAGAAAYALLVPRNGSAALDGSGIGFTGPMLRGSWLTTGDAEVKNTSQRFSARIESVHPNAGPGMEVTAVHVYLVPKPVPHMGLGTVPGWPPRDPNSSDAKYQAYLRAVPTLPASLTIPPGRTAQFIFGMRSTARPGATVWVHGVDVRFSQHWMKYRYRAQYTATFRVVASR